ncbi:NUDIX hydrolase family protein [soil metagenome]
MPDSDILETSTTWLPEEDLTYIRERVPTVYVEAVPVRTNHLGEVEKVGLLLRPRPDGSLSRALVSGRVLFGETVREALWRHLNKDLGPDADPVLPTTVAPFTIAEYFPDPGRTGFSDVRQHAVSLVFIVPVTGECTPSQDALEFTWMSVEDATSPLVAGEMSGGQDRLIRQAMGHVGRLP